MTNITVTLFDYKDIALSIELSYKLDVTLKHT